jgi:hypothetical protein
VLDSGLLSILEFFLSLTLPFVRSCCPCCPQRFLLLLLNFIAPTHIHIRFFVTHTRHNCTLRRFRFSSYNRNFIIIDFIPSSPIHPYCHRSRSGAYSSDSRTPKLVLTKKYFRCDRRSSIHKIDPNRSQVRRSRGQWQTDQRTLTAPSMNRVWTGGIVHIHIKCHW